MSITTPSILLIQGTDGNPQSLRLAVDFFLRHRMLKDENDILSWSGLVVPNLPHLQRPPTRGQLHQLLDRSKHLIVILSGTKFDDWLLYSIILILTEPTCEVVVLRDSYVSESPFCSLQHTYSGTIVQKRPMEELVLTSVMIDRVARFFGDATTLPMQETMVAARKRFTVLHQFYVIHPIMASTTTTRMTEVMEHLIRCLDQPATSPTHRWLAYFTKNVLGSSYAICVNKGLSLMLPKWITPNVAEEDIPMRPAAVPAVRKLFK
jgi:hypothetical protein